VPKVLAIAKLVHDPKNVPPDSALLPAAFTQHIDYQCFFETGTDAALCDVNALNISWEHHMKTLIRSGLIAALLGISATAGADVSANLGFASEYYYRGIFQESTSASGGLDYENSGFYAGTWAADVGDGLEVDGYLGYGLDLGDATLSVGYTGYFYTGDFDDTYQEINLGLGYGIASFDVAVGQYDGDFDDITPGEQQDYLYYALTLEKNGFYGKYAGFSQDTGGEYVELGYATTVAELDVGVTLIFSNEELVGENDEAIVFTIGKSFDLNGD
jgi:uncharacterized protein (TIGR02001 family)